MKKYLLLILSILLLLLCLVYFANRSYLMRPSNDLEERYYDTLAALGVQSINTLDVPVASIILYKNKIIGSGYNTVKRNNKLGEHAEINALSDAIERLGSEQFKQLERDSLILITTFEPCMMCTGALIELRIQHVHIVKEKTFKENIINEWKWFKYLFSRKKIPENDLQDSLFRLHPHYHE